MKINCLLKYICATITLLLFSGSGNAEYQEMLSVGKAWKIKYVNEFRGTEYYQIFSVEKDTIIDGQACKQIKSHPTQEYVTSVHGDTYHLVDGYIYAKEENKVISEYVRTLIRVEDDYREICAWQFLPFINFELKKGETAIIKDSSNTEQIIKILDSGIINIKGRNYNVLFTNSRSDLAPEIWIEGIGSTCERISDYGAVPTNGVTRAILVECWENGELLIDEDDFKNLYKQSREISDITNGVNAIDEATEDQNFYDLTGIRVALPKKNNIYIQNHKIIKY